MLRCAYRTTRRSSTFSCRFTVVQTVTANVTHNVSSTFLQARSSEKLTPEQPKPPHQERPDFLVPNLWPPNSPDLSPVDYEIWAVMQHRVYHRQIHSVDELKRRLIDVWSGLEQSIFDETIDQWQGRL